MAKDKKKMKSYQRRKIVSQIMIVIMALIMIAGLIISLLAYFV